MALNFPDSPTIGQQYTDTTSGFTYQWDGVVWKSFTGASASNIQIIDDISASFNGSTATFALAVSGTAVYPVNSQQLQIVLGGIPQKPVTDYYIAGSNVVFTTAPAAGLSFSGLLLGSAITPVGVATAGSVYVKQAYTPTGVQTSFAFSYGYTTGYLEVYRNGVKLVNTDDYTATNGTTFSLTPPAQNGDNVEAVAFLPAQLYSVNGVLSNLLVTGISTLGNTVVGGATTALVVNGDARVTGILTVGTSSITLDGANNTINVGTLSISQSGISGGTPDVTARNISGVAATFTGNVSIGGTLTYEDVTNVDSVGLITARSGVNVTGGSVVVGSAVTLSSGGINVVGVVTATSFVGALTGNATGLTGNPSITVNALTATSAVVGSAVTINSSGVNVAGILTVTQINDAGGNVRALTNNIKNTSYTLAIGDVGELIGISTGGVTVPQNIFSAGDNVTIYNNSASSQTITQGTGVTLRLAGTASTGNRTLELRGLATVLCVASNEFVISGAGLA